MEINNTNILTLFEKNSNRLHILPGRDRQTGTDATGLDKVELSNLGQNFSRFSDMIYAVPDVRELRVDEMLFAIKSGNYNDVKAEQVAEKIIKGDFVG